MKSSIQTADHSSRVFLDPIATRQARIASKKKRTLIAHESGIGISRLDKAVRGTYSLSVNEVASLARSLGASPIDITRRDGEPTITPTDQRPKEGDLHDFAPHLRRELHNMTEPRVLYAAVTDGKFLMSLLTDVDIDVAERDTKLTTANLSKIELRIMRADLMETLANNQIIDEALPRDLRANLHALEGLQRVPWEYRSKRPIPKKLWKSIEVGKQEWPGLPPVWGLLIGDLVMFGPWRVTDHGTYVPSMRGHIAYRSGPGASEFMKYSQLLMTGMHFDPED